jgi:ATP-binding cassette subfamily F protein 3
VDRRDERRLAAEKRERLRPWRNRIASLEKDMEKLQAELRPLDERLQDPALYEAARAGEVQDLLRRQGALKQELAACEEDWLTACEELEALESA